MSDSYSERFDAIAQAIRAEEDGNSAFAVWPEPSGEDTRERTQQLVRKLLDMETRGRRYTLEEAAQELARRECLEFGHTLNYTEDEDTFEPVVVFCENCGSHWHVRVHDE